jgi:hypothetical protein
MRNAPSVGVRGTEESVAASCRGKSGVCEGESRSSEGAESEPENESAGETKSLGQRSCSPPSSRSDSDDCSSQLRGESDTRISGCGAAAAWSRCRACASAEEEEAAAAAAAVMVCCASCCWRRR